MKKSLFFSFLFLMPQFSHAVTCYGPLEEERKRIDDKPRPTTNVGTSFYPITVSDKYENWALDFRYSLESGCKLISVGVDKNREEILKTFEKTIKPLCPEMIGKENHDHSKVRELLTELMKDGSFCPESRMLNRPVLDPWKNYRIAVKNALQSGRFSVLCGKNVKVNQSEIIKSTTPPGSQKPQDSSSSNQ